MSPRFIAYPIKNQGVGFKFRSGDAVRQQIGNIFFFKMSLICCYVIAKKQLNFLDPHHVRW